MKRKQKRESKTGNPDVDKVENIINNGGDSSDNIDSDDNDIKNLSLQTHMLVTSKKSKKKTGGFQSMGLSYPVLKGILKRGYKVPTPIQRKTIPVIMEGKDVVAMARTGSGKTGAFLIPMLERLKARVLKVGARALIFSPTRELAMQTQKFTKELARHMSLKSLLLLGGEKMEEQFSAIHQNPDIIIATPGRFLHLMMEMDLKLTSIEYVVFDEADRLFEMGFQEQIQEVLNRLPDHRQTLMFSATLPRVLVDFVHAGLTDPVLIRLDVEHKLSDNLKTIYLCCRPMDKPAILLHLLKNKINLSNELTVVFLATRHHIEYIKDILTAASIDCTYIYSSLDQAARKINVARFRSKQVGVLLVTDIAARGIDIPFLDNVINYNFPSKPKLFVHRVGRVARAGRSGTAYSLVAPDEAPYLLDLHLFLGKPIKLFDEKASKTQQNGICGTVPQTVIDEENDSLRNFHESLVDLRNMVKVCDNAYNLYIKSRPAPSSESIRRVKECSLFSDKMHPIFYEKGSLEVERSKVLAGMRCYRPNTTIFELGVMAKTQAGAIMRQKRIHHSVVDKIRSMKHTLEASSDHEEEELVVKNNGNMVGATEEDLQKTFTSVKIKTSKESKPQRKKRKDFKDHEHFLTYRSQEHYSEQGLGIQNSFANDISHAVLDLTGDDSVGTLKMKSAWHWDRKKKKFMRDDDESVSKKKMKTESGVWIPKSYKSNMYEKWLDKNKVAHQLENSDDENNKAFKKYRKPWQNAKGGAANQKGNKSKRPPKREIKNKEEIMKTRKRKATKKFLLKRKEERRGKKKQR